MAIVDSRFCFGSLFLTISFIACEAFAIPPGPNYEIDIRTTRAGSLYRYGEVVVFRVRVLRNGHCVNRGTIHYALDVDGANQFEAGEHPLASQTACIQGTLEKPGFLRCVVDFHPPDGTSVQGIASAAVSPEQITPSLPPPSDFDAFWEAQIKQLSQIPLEPEMSPVTGASPALECFDVKIPCIDNVPVSGYFARPKNRKAKFHPAVLWVQGAGVTSSFLENAVKGAEQGFLSMDINAHGITNGMPDEYYVQLANGSLHGYPARGRESRETSYFRGMFLRVLRAIDFLASQPEWDGKTMIVLGHSQGGAQSIAAGALDRRVSMIGAGVPAMCDHTGMVVNRPVGWPKLVPQGDSGTPDQTVLKASRYYDMVNFAGRCKAPAILTVGFIDEACPPTTCYAAFNQLRGSKIIINEPLMGHLAPPHLVERLWEEALKHAKRRK